MTIALSLTILPQFAIEHLNAQFNRGWVNLGQIYGSKFKGVPFGVDPWSADSKHPRLTNREIISEDLDTSMSWTDGQTDGQTDDLP